MTMDELRNQAAVSAMQGLLSDNATINALTKDCFKDNMELENKVAMRAVAYADALIKELQKKKGKDYAK